MSTATLNDAVILAPPSAADWRQMAHECREIGLAETARVCERHADDLDWRPMPCSD